MAVPDYSIGFTRAEVEEILRVHKGELKKTLAQWGDGGTSVVKRRLDEVHAVIAACQDALRKLAPEVYGRTRRAAQSRVSRISL